MNTMICLNCGAPVGPGAASHIPGVDCELPSPQPVISLPLRQWQRLHQRLEETYIASMDPGYSREKISAMLQDRLRGVEEIIEFSGYDLQHRPEDSLRNERKNP